MRFAAFGCNHDYRHVFRIIDSGKLLDKLQPVHNWHVDIAQDQIDLVLFEDAQRLGTVSGLEYLTQFYAGLA
jgi:hypothetical protein